MAKLSINNLVYYIYFTAILCTFMASLNIVPTTISFTLDIIVIICFLSVFLFKINSLKTSGVILTIVFCIPILLSYLYNANNNVNITRVIYLALLYPIIFYTLNNLHSFTPISRMILPFSISILIILILSILSILGIFEFTYYGLDSSSLKYYQEISSRDTLRAVSGIYLNQNTFATILLTGIYTSLILYVTMKIKLYKRLYLLMSALCLIFLLLTLSRSAIFSTFIGLLLVFSFSKTKLITKFIVVFFVVLILIGFITSQYYDILSFKLSNSGLSHRDIIWKDALEKFSFHPLLGIGLGNYSYTYDGRNFSTHNVYIFFLVSLGVIGSLGLFISLLWVLYLSIKSFIYHQKDLNVIIVACAGISVFIHQFFEVNLDNPIGPLTIFLLTLITYLNKIKHINKVHYG